MSDTKEIVVRVRGALCSCPIPCTKECVAVVWVNDARALCDEVERLTRERDAEWRAAVERVRERFLAYATFERTDRSIAALNAILAIMEAQ